MVNVVPEGPEDGDRPVIFGGTAIVAPLLACPPTTTNREPLTAELGIFAVILVSLQLVTNASAPAVPTET